jgi:hypothetical protein
LPGAPAGGQAGKAAAPPRGPAAIEP